MYQPSVSIFCFMGVQASADDSIRKLVFTCRAWKPNISLRSPVSTAFVVYVITPPRRDGVEVISPLVAVVAGAESPLSIGVMTYFLALSLT